MSCKFGRVTRKSVFSLKRTWQQFRFAAEQTTTWTLCSHWAEYETRCVPKNYGVKYEASCLTLDLKSDHATGQ